MGKNTILTSEGARQFSDALDLLNMSIKEFTQIADHMVPERLIDAGLAVYLSEFSKMLEADHRISLTYEYEGDDRKINEDIETAMFRCFRTILFLILRYGQPSNIYLKLIKSIQLVTLSIKAVGMKTALNLSEPHISRELENVNTTLKTLHGNIIIYDRAETENALDLRIPL